MSKPNKRHNDKCKQYKQEGRRETNKIIKQKRHEKRMNAFKKRREEGRAYVYVPIDLPNDSYEYQIEKANRMRKVEEAEKRREKSKGEYRKWKSIYGKVSRGIELIKEAEKEEEAKRKDKKQVVGLTK